ncbi:MAG TPA: beta-galactosidase [Firmicutes bacterium]|nr:beta-galactosidase [Bacillota bacterium]
MVDQANQELCFRQVHLDFHTSEAIKDVASKFDPEEFAEVLEQARVNSITCFARCHHGWLYYDSKKFPERVHPHLNNRNLLKEQIEACHRRGIRVPVYITVQWDHYTATRHPEWVAVTAAGQFSGTPPFEPGFYRNLCINTPYRDFLKEMTAEVMQSLPVDGLFFDIVSERECACRHCVDGMKNQGLDPASQNDRQLYAKQTLDQFKLDLTKFVRAFDQQCSIFFNAGHIGPYIRDSLPAYTHLELESLPSGGWGYLHFPLTMRYARTLGLDCLSHTGRFHTWWGDFHSFKNAAALEFECFQMLALNAKCLIGDQLHPDGKISRPVYDLIGSVYRQVEQKEPWCQGARAVTDLAVFHTEEFDGKQVSPPVAGALRMLQEAGHQFDIVDSRSDFTPYKVLILPDRVQINNQLAQKLEHYLAGGGKLIASAFSGLDADNSEFKLKSLGVKLRQPLKRDGSGELVAGKRMERNDYAEYILPKGAIGKGLPDTEHVMYLKGVEVTAAGDAEVLVDTIASYFDRSWEHFCSHQHTPASGTTDYPAVVKCGEVIYFAHPIFTQYYINAPRWCRTLVLNAIDMLLPQPLLRHNGPSSLVATVNEQAKANRWVVHLLHYIPERRCQDIDVIEDVIPLYNVTLSIKVPKTVKSVCCVPAQERIDFRAQDGRIEFVVSEINGHQMVELSFGR